MVFKLPMQSIQTRKGDFEVVSRMLTTTAYQLMTTITEVIPSSYEIQTSSIQTSTEEIATTTKTVETGIILLINQVVKP